jgi:alpha-ketoglutarate-dependent taurine dioxygenase
MNATEFRTLAGSFGGVVEGRPGEDLLALDMEAVADLLRERKAVLFQGFAADSAAFTALTERLGSNFMNYKAGASDRKKLNDSGTLLSVTGHQKKTLVPFHGEMHYKKVKPSLLWFYCERPAARGGETTVCDAAELFERLSPRTQKLFLEKRVRYIRTYAADQWPAIFQTDDLDAVRAVCAENDLALFVEPDGGVRTEYVCSAVVPKRGGEGWVFINNVMPIALQEIVRMKGSRVRFEDGSRIPLRVIWELFRVGARLEIKVRWRPGDVLLVDNTQAMHGRKGYRDSARSIFARMSDARFPL